MFPTIRNTALAAVSLLSVTSNLSKQFYTELADIATTLSSDIFNEPNNAYIEAVDATMNWDEDKQEELMRTLAIMAGIQRDPMGVAAEKFYHARLTNARLRIIAFEAGC